MDQVLEKLRRSLRMKQRPLPKKEKDSRELYVWVNEKLGERANILLYNKWYGDFPEWGKNGVTLLFPTRTASKLSVATLTLEKLKMIIRKASNWTRVRCIYDVGDGIRDDVFIDVDMIDSPGGGAQISNIEQYFNYLKS